MTSNLMFNIVMFVLVLVIVTVCNIIITKEIKKANERYKMNRWFVIKEEEKDDK